MSIATESPETIASENIAVAPPLVPADLFFRLSVEQYHEMIRREILKGDEPVELLEGWLVRKMPKSPLHSLVTLKARRALDRLLPDGYYANSQEPMSTGTSEPEPDVLVIRGDPEQFRDHHPGPEDILVLIEVSASSLARDRGWKKQIYAKFLIVEYWVLNLLDRRIEVYTEPTGPAEAPDYRQRRDFGPDDEIPVMIEGREVGRVAVRDVLP